MVPGGGKTQLAGDLESTLDADKIIAMSKDQQANEEEVGAKLAKIRRGGPIKVVAPATTTALSQNQPEEAT